MVSFKPFRELMKERGITTYFLRNKCQQYNLGNKTLDRLLHDESVSTNTVDALCQIFHCKVTDILEILPDAEQEESSRRD